MKPRKISTDVSFKISVTLVNIDIHVEFEYQIFIFLGELTFCEAIGRNYFIRANQSLMNSLKIVSSNISPLVYCNFYLFVLLRFFKHIFKIQLWRIVESKYC